MSTILTNGVFLSLLASVCWGLCYSIANEVLQHINPIYYIFVYNLMGVLILLPFVLYNQTDFVQSYINLYNNNHHILWWMAAAMLTTLCGVLCADFALSFVNNAALISLLEI